ncbi:MAG TPA: hypothetical protein VK540_03015 [Polyangiaceae bacterium]|nr:hypothetical protein [Polyangiaceae bacterium]
MLQAVAGAHSLAIRDSRAWAFRLALLVALVAHLPFTPLPFILRWLGVYLHRSDTSWDYQDDSVIIPISLVEDTPSAPPAARTPETAATSAPADEAKPRPPAPGSSKDAGLADAGPDAATDAGPPDAAAGAGREGRKTRDSGAERATLLALGDGGADAAEPGVKDTMSLVGGLRRAVKSKPNVALVFWFSTMREHPLGPLVGSLLSCNPQWRDFLGDVIDPLQDLDGVMLVGPRMSETSKLTILVQSRMDDAKVRQVMGLVGAAAHRSGVGGPIDAGVGTQAIRFHADRADRVAFTHPKNLIIVTPPEGFEQLQAQREAMSLPAGRGQAMSLTMVNPWRPLRALGMRLPETLSEIRVNVFATDNGGVRGEIEFDDQDAALAAAHAGDITDQARAAAGPLASDITFVAEGNRLHAETRLARITSAIALGFVRAQICPPAAFDAGRAPR